MLTGNHTATVSYCYGDWRIHAISMGALTLDLQSLLPLLTEDRLFTVDFEDIAWKGKHLPNRYVGENCLCCDGERYHKADTSFPCILLEGANNPYDLRYRALDGKHRLQRLVDAGETEGPCYVLSLKEVTHLLNPA